MTKGKASGPNRDYQKLAHDIIQQLQSEQHLVPYKDDGVDIPFDMAGTTVTFDAVLRSPDGKLVVVECKRYKNRRIQQRDLFAFWGEAEWLRRTKGVPVDGIFVSRYKFQEGAHRAAAGLGIRLAICEQNQSVDNCVIAFQRLNDDKTRNQDFVARITSNIKHSVTVSAEVNPKT
jgi:hypothetical protein